MDISEVAIITRTKNRPLLLRRCLKSILAQTFKDFIWVVVNDAGECGPVDDIVQQALEKGVKAVAIHLSISKGMQHASNVGIQSSESKYIVILDDDDTHHPLFLEKTANFLENHAQYKGVVTHCYRVEEKLTETDCREIRRSPYNLGLVSVYLADMAAVNPFPPAAFLYHRDAAEQIGLYSETTGVLGDWHFNLLFLEKFDIGVIPQLLANYHFRVNIKLNSDPYGNTLIAGVDEHVEYDALVRNALFRRDAELNRIGVGLLVNQARMLARLDSLLDQLGPVLKLLRILRNIVRYLKRRL